MKRTSMAKRFSVMIFLTVVLTIILCGCGGKSIGKSPVASTADLPGKTIGTQMGTTGDIYAADYVEQGSVIRQFNKGADAIMALKQGKVDCVIIDSEPARKFVDLNSDLSVLDEEFITEEYAICIAKEKEQLLNDINAALQQLREDGTLDSISRNYIGTDAGNHPYISPDGIVRMNGTLRMATNAAFEPYEFVQNGEIVGIDVDIAQAIADILGMELEIQDIEFDSIITAVQSGKADIGVAGMTVTEDRLKNINFSDSYANTTQVIIVRNGNGSGGVQSITDKFRINFIEDNRWQYITKGLLTTVRISFFAVILGVILGFLLAIIRFSCDTNGKLRLLNWICKLYITIIRGTPAMIQLLIIFYVVFASWNINAEIVAIIAFGMNSSAYIAEIVRSGLSSIDKGQLEAGRSLGFGYAKTMIYFILPQAIRNVLPALGNEFIVLLKETSISSYIGIRDLTRGGDLIRSNTYDAFMPLIAVALIYLAIVMLLSMLVGKLERRLASNDKR